MQREPLGLNFTGLGWKERTDSPELYSDPHRHTVACVHLHPPPTHACMHMHTCAHTRTHMHAMLIMTISTEFSSAEVEALLSLTQEQWLLVDSPRAVEWAVQRGYRAGNISVEALIFLESSLVVVHSLVAAPPPSR